MAIIRTVGVVSKPNTRAAAETVGLRFLDHVIVTETEWSRIP